LVGIGCFLILTWGYDSKSTYLFPVLILVTKLGLAGGFVVLYVSNNFIFPTLFAASAFGICNFVARIGCIFAPIIVEMFARASIKILAFFSVIALVLSIFVKENKIPRAQPPPFKSKRRRLLGIKEKLREYF
jgi:hypothetical protein